MGGDCLNTGCVPSKTLIRSAKVAKEVKESANFGIINNGFSVDFSSIMERVQEVIKKIEPNDSAKRYEELGAKCFKAKAYFKGPWELSLGEKTITAKNIVIATGGGPIVPRFEGIEKVSYLTNENLWELRELPKRFLILGGGVIGCEIAQSFQRLGSQVIMIERGDSLIRQEDPEVRDLMLKTLRGEGVEVETSNRRPKGSHLQRPLSFLTRQVKGKSNLTKS